MKAIKVSSICGYPFLTPEITKWAKANNLSAVVGAENLSSGDSGIVLIENAAFLESNGIPMIGYVKVGLRYVKTGLPPTVTPLLFKAKAVVRVFKENRRLPPRLLVDALIASTKSGLSFGEPHSKVLKGMISRHLPPSLKDKFEPPKQKQKSKDKKAGSF